MKSEEEWRKKLTLQQYHILREKGTEPPFSGQYADCKDTGVYKCAGCGQDLFSSGTKFESGTGWPSFTEPMKPESVKTQEDQGHGMARTEVLCPSCGGHLGHVFNDGPAQTGLRYCINSAALDFQKNDKKP